MKNELNKILISSTTPAWHEKIREIHRAVKQAAYFEEGSEQDKQLNDIILTIKDQGQSEQAIIDFTEQFDGVTLAWQDVRIKEEELEDAHKKISAEEPKLLKSIRLAINNVRKYQTEIFIGSKEQNKHPGIRYTPIKRVGICVPGASAPLPSTVIMTAVPAQVADVKEIAVVSPPRYKGTIHPVILAVCYELKVEEVYRIGGAHAVAALAFGTRTIEPVDKIVGPGNQWVQMAKRKLFGYVDIDSIAGPSEVLIIANDDANPAWVAADMLSQAEHAPGSALVFTDSQKLAKSVLVELKNQIKQLSRSKETVDCLIKFGAIISFEKLDEAIAQANYFAPEHLEIQCGDKSKELADKIVNAGAIFIGDYSPVAVGDYWAGPSHTLPTGMTAKFFSALSANDFIKSTSIIEYDKKMLEASAEDIIRLAEAEGLDAHAKSIKIRQQG